MGFNAVELLLAAEEKCGIHVHDADASNIATPRMMAD
jgi:acyl carrier protein